MPVDARELYYADQKGKLLEDLKEYADQKGKLLEDLKEEILK